MTLTVLRAADRAAVPWKNGGGVTREVAAWPPGSGFDDFQWRVSMAEVTSDGPFSIFPNVDRILAVLEGRLRLDVEGMPPVSVSRDTPPAIFPGDAPTAGKVEAGPVLDLNIMTRRGQVGATLRRIDTKGVLITHATSLTIAIGGAVRVGGVELGPLDAALVTSDAAPLDVTPFPGAFTYVVTLIGASPG